MIYIGADHRGWEVKGHISRWLAGRGYEFEDMGAYEYDVNDDYVDFAIAVAQKVAEAPGKNRGIVVCGGGVGVSIAANKVLGIRCGLGFAPDQVHAARKADNINMLAIAADNTEENEAVELAAKFLETEFVESENYLRRLEKISRYEREVVEHK